MSQLPDTASESRKDSAHPSGGPTSKRRQKRVLDRAVNKKSIEIDKALKLNIEKGAEELGVSTTELAQRFAIVAPVAEQRFAMWWNGYVSDRAEAWKSEYSGPWKNFLGWVIKRIVDEDEYLTLSDEQKEEYTKRVIQKRAENHEGKAAAITREKVVAAIGEKLDSVHKEVITI
ncbi:hypothetical protein FS749_009470 [Ceratobasidium sp. UAMH 11750]|nr:hypothetical protein FS749_009470 [Ceratobasidium sp. UAMH 11750]